jgi:hypothetical protein
MRASRRCSSEIARWRRSSRVKASASSSPSRRAASSGGKDEGGSPGPPWGAGRTLPREESGASSSPALAGAGSERGDPPASAVEASAQSACGSGVRWRSTPSSASELRAGGSPSLPRRTSRACPRIQSGEATSTPSRWQGSLGRRRPGPPARQGGRTLSPPHETPASSHASFSSSIGRAERTSAAISSAASETCSLLPAAREAAPRAKENFPRTSAEQRTSKSRLLAPSSPPASTDPRSTARTTLASSSAVTSRA